MPLIERLTLTKPDDWHLHVRDAELLPQQRFGRIFVSLLSQTQVYCRGSNSLGVPNVTGYQFPRAVVEALALHLRQGLDRFLQAETKTLGDTP